MEITIVSEAKTKNSFIQKKLCILLVPNLMIPNPKKISPIAKINGDTLNKFSLFFKLKR